jgi:hypothetical protein
MGLAIAVAVVVSPRKEPPAKAETDSMDAARSVMIFFIVLLSIEVNDIPNH